MATAQERTSRVLTIMEEVHGKDVEGRIWDKARKNLDDGCDMVVAFEDAIRGVLGPEYLDPRIAVIRKLKEYCDEALHSMEVPDWHYDLDEDIATNAFMTLLFDDMKLWVAHYRRWARALKGNR